MLFLQQKYCATEHTNADFGQLCFSGSVSLVLVQAISGKLHL